MTKLATNGWKEISHLINFIHIGELLTNLAPRVRQDIRRLILLVIAGEVDIFFRGYHLIW